ncbi:hypothetical protein NKG05_20795 [Oerskovia sp. M15]
MILAENVGATDRIVNAGRWSGGAVSDLLTRNAANGELLLRRGNGGGLLDFPARIGLGWSSLSSITGAATSTVTGSLTWWRRTRPERSSCTRATARAASERRGRWDRSRPRRPCPES